ncbi:FKBP-type peptidyl-prolyl cis-trans isomerase SlyD [Thiogranum longum]|uniref:peptidylprolyl isomerase n=1 Tax=Thiogranum longum TaxID=1537524 RepID=A0A4R1HHT2_9GAMM|nr:FKBP-type peptidyl-prolyl cis-trans isomerase [Thiogranum longum]TCK18969.1 FKBP-type peptidyl-prolyl cis-trans isomerase SlyD [Thiogranum longum]
MKSCDLPVIDNSTIEICQDKVVRLGFRVTDQQNGHLLQYGDDLVYLHGGYGGAFPKIEQAIQGCRVGDQISVSLSPEEGYGQHNPELVIELPGEAFSGELPHTGEAVDGQLPDGSSMTFTVSEVSGESIRMDGNHPFAGKYLAFDFEVLEVRSSTSAERSAGYAFDGMLNC